MSQSSVETPASSSTGGPKDLLPDRLRSDDGKRKRSRASTSAILFNELVLARFRWFALHARFGELGGAPMRLAPEGLPADPPSEEDRDAAEAAYRKTLERFTDLEGEIVAAHWSVSVPSGVVMTTRTRRWPLNLFFEPKLSVHRATTWLTGPDSHVAELLHHCDTLGNKASEILRRTPKRVAMTWIFSTQSYLLGVVEERARCAPPAAAETNGRSAVEPAADGGGHAGGNGQGPAADGGSAQELAAAVATQQHEDDLVTRGRSEIVEIEKYYDRAAANAARFIYFWGMLVGILLAAAGALLVALVVDTLFGVIDTGSTSTRFFFACYAAGALGAVVSVLTRMRSDEFRLDYEVGRTPAFWLGTFRPFLGAVFGLVVYFALESSVVQLPPPADGKEFFFLTLFAFAAGFSERLTQVILGGAERTIEATLDQADEAVGKNVAARTATGTGRRT